ncbi:MAG: hypothetical protein KY459_15115 [Acidobacteria bacterium]|nr:hypothetical protein [Acidobacteriota bacterium]
MRRWIRWVAGTVVTLLLVWLGFAAIVRPSNDRDWTIDQSRLATAVVDDPLVTIRNVRNFDYKSETDLTP